MVRMYIIYLYEINSGDQHPSNLEAHHSKTPNRSWVSMHALGLSQQPCQGIHWQSYHFAMVLTTWSLFWVSGKRDKPSSWFCGVGGVAQAKQWSLHIKLMCQMCLDGPLRADVWKQVCAFGDIYHTNKVRNKNYILIYRILILPLFSWHLFYRRQKHCIRARSPRCVWYKGTICSD